MVNIRNRTPKKINLRKIRYGFDASRYSTTVTNEILEDERQAVIKARERRLTGKVIKVPDFIKNF